MTYPQSPRDDYYNSQQPAQAGYGQPSGNRQQNQSGYAGYGQYNQPDYGQPTGYGQSGTTYPTSYGQPGQPVGFLQQETVGSWVFSIFLAGLPVVGIVYLIIAGFNNETNIPRRNWARAVLIWQLIYIALAILGYVALGAAMYGMLNELEPQ